MNSTSLRQPSGHKATQSAQSATLPLQRNAWNVSGEEAVIADSRAKFTPAEAVESKLRYLLRSSPIGVSHLMTGRLAARRPR
jgi:hypothetical protein